MIEQATEKKFRFIPYRKRDIVEMCLQDNLLPGQEENFRNLYHMLDSIFHFEFHQIIESLKESYAPIDPDSDTRQYENTEHLADLIQGPSRVHHIAGHNVPEIMHPDIRQSGPAFLA